MPKDTQQIADWVARRQDRIAKFTDMALCNAAEAKGSTLDEDEVDAILEWVRWQVLAFAHGVDPHVWAAAMQAEAKGQQVVH
jgi:hypothetical protein